MKNYMKKYNCFIKKILVLILISIFTASNISYGQTKPCLRPPVGISSERAASAIHQYGIRLKSGTLNYKESRSFSRQFDKFADELIKSGKAWTVFSDREPLSGRENERRITIYPSDSNFFKELRDQAKVLLEAHKGFDVIILDRINLPFDVMLHPGPSRNQAYMTLSVIKILEDMYNQLRDEYKPEFIKIILAAFEHEATHISLRDALKNRSPPEVERAVDENSPSFMARELFRLVYMAQKIDDPGLKPDINMFFSNLKAAKNKASHLFAYTGLSPEKQLDIVEKLIPSSKKRHSRIDIILAQHHIGHALTMVLKNPEDVNSLLFQRAVNLLKGKNLIDKGPEINKPYPVWRFIRELITQDRVAQVEDIARSIIIVSNIEQLETWTRGTEATVGDTVRYPMPGEAMALPIITKDKAKNIINAIPDESLSPGNKHKIIENLKANKEGQVLISHEDLKIIGEALFNKAVTSTSAAGAGTRFAVVEGFDDRGDPIFQDKAKGVLQLEAVEGGRSFIEMFLAQAAYINKEHALAGNKVPCIIYTSHLTDKDVQEEMIRIGYKVLSKKSSSRYVLYGHSDPYYSDVTVVRLHKTNLLSRYNADFFSDVDPSIHWSEAHWPYAHDSPIIDLIVSGLAYEMFEQGKKYVDISNIDNRAGGTDPIVLAIMELTNTPLVNEAALKPKGEKGGGAPVKLKEPLFRGHMRGNLEGPNMDLKFTAEQTAQFIPDKNTANYCVNIIEYIKQAFLNPGASDQDAINFLKEFYEAREDEERKAELKFKKIEAVYRVYDKFMFLEISKRFPAIQAGSLLGTLTWLVDTLFVDVPQGPGSGQYTRFEEQKQNIVNLKRVVDFLKNKIGENGTAAANITIDDAMEDFKARRDRRSASELKYAIKSIGLKQQNGATKLMDLLRTAEEAYSIQSESLDRVNNKGGRYYEESKADIAERILKTIDGWSSLWPGAYKIPVSRDNALSGAKIVLYGYFRGKIANFLNTISLVLLHYKNHPEDFSRTAQIMRDCLKKYEVFLDDFRRKDVKDIVGHDREFSAGLKDSEIRPEDFRQLCDKHPESIREFIAGLIDKSKPCFDSLKKDFDKLKVLIDKDRLSELTIPQKSPTGTQL